MSDRLRRAQRWIPWVLAAVTFALYWPVHSFQFLTYDDPDFVTANPTVQAGLTARGFKWAWGSEVARNWHPVTMLTHMFDCDVFGLKPGGPHLVNLLWHMVNALLLYFLLRRMTGAVWRSAAVAALFAWHPLHVESVAWIAERKDVLSTFFWLAATWFYVDYARAGKRRGVFYALAFVLLAIGLMCKPMLVTAPFGWWLLDYWPLRRWKAKDAPRLVLEKIPFLALSAAASVITYRVQQHGGSVLGVNNLSIGARLGNAFISYWRYLGKMAWPAHLNALYLRAGSWPAAAVGLAAAGLVGVTVIALAQSRRRPWLIIGWFWYLGTLVPVIGLVQAGMQTMADRYTYVPLIGIFIIVAWGGTEAAEKWRRPSWAFVAAAAGLVACLILTSRQLGYWKDSPSLYGRMIEVMPGNYMAHYNLANFDEREGRTNDAIAEFSAALSAEPNYSDAHNNLGAILLDQRMYDAAVEQYRDALRINRGFLQYFNLANALADTASARHDSALFAEAVQRYDQALQLDPNSAAAHYNLGLTWQAEGRMGDALAEWRAVVAIDPQRLDAWRGLAMGYAMAGQMSDAADAFRAIIRLRPDDATAYGNLGNALSAQKRFDEASAAYSTALRLNPADYQTEFNLGLSYLQQGRRTEALTHLELALRLNPNYPAARQLVEQIRHGAR